MPAKKTGDIWNKLTQDNFGSAYYSLKSTLSNTLWVINWQQSGKPILDPEFIAARQMGLERFLHRLVAQPKLASDKIVLEFLTVENGWDEKVEATDYVKKSGKKSTIKVFMVLGWKTSPQWRHRRVCVYWFSKKPLGWSKSRPNLKLIIRKLLKWNIILKESGSQRVSNVIMMSWSFCCHCAHFVTIRIRKNYLNT